MPNSGCGTTIPDEAAKAGEGETGVAAPDWRSGAQTCYNGMWLEHHSSPRAHAVCSPNMLLLLSINFPVLTVIHFEIKFSIYTTLLSIWGTPIDTVVTVVDPITPEIDANTKWAVILRESIVEQICNLSHRNLARPVSLPMIFTLSVNNLLWIWRGILLLKKDPSEW